MPNHNTPPQAISYVTSTGRLVTEFTRDMNRAQKIIKSQLKRTNVFVDGYEHKKIKSA